MTLVSCAQAMTRGPTRARGSDGLQLSIAYGTGSAPANGAAATGSTPGENIHSGANQIPFSQVVLASGLTLNHLLD